MYNRIRCHISAVKYILIHLSEGGKKTKPGVATFQSRTDPLYFNLEILHLVQWIHAVVMALDVPWKQVSGGSPGAVSEFSSARLTCT